MFHRRGSSEDRRLWLVKFECEGEDGARHSVYIDDEYTSRRFIETGDEEEIRERILEMISSGRLSLDPEEGDSNISISSIERDGDVITVRLRSEKSSMERGVTPRYGLTRPRGLKMGATTEWDIVSKVLDYLEGNSFLEFLELLKSIAPVVEERTMTPFDGKTIHPISSRTILSEMTVYSKGLVGHHKREAKTVILLDRSVSMSNAWSIWEECPKVKVAKFLVRAVQALQFNSVLLSFGVNAKEEPDLEAVEGVDKETRLDRALMEAALQEPERLVILTDGKPVYSENQETEELGDAAIKVLDAMSRSRINVLLVLLGYDYDMVRFYRRLQENPSVTLIELAAQSDIIGMMEKFSHWL